MQVIETQKIVKGQPAQIAVLLAKPNGERFPTCGLSEVILSLKKDDNTLLQKPASAGMTWGYGDPLSIYSFVFTDDETSLLQNGAGLSGYLKLVFPSVTLKFVVTDFVTISDGVF